MNLVEAVRLVAARELKVKLRDKTFLFSTLFFLLFAAVSTVLPALLADGPSSVAVAQASPYEGRLREAGLHVKVAADPERVVRDGDADAAVVDKGGKPEVLAMKSAPSDVVNALSTAPEVRLLNPAAAGELASFLVPFMFALVFFFTSLTFGIQIAQSVAEEKQTRMVEILVAAVPVRALLIGKVAAGGILALAQVALISAVSVAGAQFTDDATSLLPLIGPAMTWFIPFFVLGFVMLASLWAAVGALVNRLEDVGNAGMPVQLAVMLPFFAVMFLRDNAAVMRVLSYVPLSAPTAMPVRVFTGDAAAWEPLVALVLLAAATAGALLAGARLYEGSLLRTNGRTSWRAAWRDRELSRV
ncbi:ABC transporter permease [Dactylosporangium salmoneum]|uniref:ABC-2 type transporter transmembrane domain-containing protein n=1 Tax=Dactylosporangium salmoneum TaxID=53361 RepID=A0ABN3FVG0_9ACTN